MTEVQSRMQRKALGNYKGRQARKKDGLNAPLLRKVKYSTKSTEKEHRKQKNISQDNIKTCDDKTGRGKRLGAVMCFGITAALGYHRNDLNMPPCSALMGRRIYNSH